MRKLFQFPIFIILSIVLGSCQQTTKPNEKKKIKTERKVLQYINVLPLGKVDSNVLSAIKVGIEKFYRVTPIIEKEVPLTDDLSAKSRTRYEANKILSKFKCNKNLLIITESDIAIKYKKHNSEEWGIMGLGYRPGKTCVVSTFRVKKNASETLFKERLIKICIHEIGHNLGLPHCAFDPKCLMNDANGTISQVDKEGVYFCKKCRRKLETR